MAGEKERGRRAAVCRTQKEIKGASLSIDCIKIGLHLQLSYCRCLFVCLDESCDLAKRTLFAQHPGNRGKKGGVDRGRHKKGGKRKEKEEGESHCSTARLGFLYHYCLTCKIITCQMVYNIYVFYSGKSVNMKPALQISYTK